MKFGSRPPWPGEINLGVIFGAVIILGLPVAFGFGDYFVSIYPGCPFKIMTGIPCLTCGFTRSVLALRNGDFSRSLRISPLLWALVTIILLWFMWSAVLYFTKKEIPEIKIRIGERKWVLGGVLLFLILYWGYLIWTGV